MPKGVKRKGPSSSLPNPRHLRRRPQSPGSKAPTPEELRDADRKRLLETYLRPKQRTGGGKKTKRKVSASFLAAGKSWREHLSQYRKANPNMSLKQQMKGASKTYKKGSVGVTVRTSKYEVKVRPRSKAMKRKTKRPKKRTGRKKRSFLGF